MRISGKTTTYLFEAAEAVGIRREDLVEPLGLDAAQLADPRKGTDWDTFAAVLEELSKRLDGDAERMRDIGRSVLRVPSFVFFKKLARTLVSPRSLYEVGQHWVAPANFPHLHLEQFYLSDTRIRFRASIPEPHTPSVAFFHIFEGNLTELPSLLGLPRATIVSSELTPRELDTTIELPASSSVFGRVRRRLRAALNSGEAIELLEQQRREIAEGLESVKRSTDELRVLFDRLPDLVIIHRDGIILWTNRAVPKVLGYASDDLVGRPLLDIVDPVSRELVSSRMQAEVDHDALAEDYALDLVETRLLTRDGDVLLAEVSPTQEVSFGGQPARLVVGRDVTERMRLRQQLLTADRMASIGMLAAGVAHEVNNPLAYVLNNIEIAVKELTPLGESTRASRDALGIALEGVDRIRTIVRELLELARVDDAAVGPVDVRAIVESTVALAAQKISERARLETHYAPVPLARGTAARLGQVLLNLLTNALEAMPPGSMETNRLRVSVRHSAAGGVVVEVSDNGVGIARENAARVFDPFFTTKSSGSGTGLGLAISQRLVAELGGELAFESVPDLGTTFSLTLLPEETPVSARATAHTAASTPPASSPSGISPMAGGTAPTTPAAVRR
jgi:PAS domain S-box-containing protein